jgi:hypothetical protein
MGVKIRRFDLRSKQSSRTSSFMQARSSGLIGLAGCTKGRQRGRTTAAERVNYGGQIMDAVAATAGSACVGGGRARLRSQGAGCDGCSITMAGCTARNSGFTQGPD